ncbi:MAG: acylphosphatase [Candidatus Methylacidiphilales bacterium]
MIAHQTFYSGRVQGVGFRYSVQQIAAGYDVTGYVRNLDDGRVECWLQGDPSEVSAMEEAIANSHLRGFIKATEVRDVPPDPDAGPFRILR